MTFVYRCLSLAHAFFFFFFNETATTEIYPLPLHDALPISAWGASASTWRSRRRVTSTSWCAPFNRSEEHTPELQSHSFNFVCRLLLEKKSKCNSSASPAPTGRRLLFFSKWRSP